MKFFFTADQPKDNVFDSIKTMLEENGFKILNKEYRPWGGFFVIDEKQTNKFIEEFFSAAEIDTSAKNKLSPKILVVAPNKRLSWQYHLRREEFWKVISEEAGLISSDTDNQNELKTFGQGTIINLKQGERHRLVGLKTWGVVAEIWKHTDNLNPSNEEDIIRLQDDFGR